MPSNKVVGVHGQAPKIHFSRRLKRGLVLFVVLAGASCSNSLETSPTIVWQDYDPVLLDQARQKGQPAIVEFYAEWCEPCIELERFTFSDQRVIESTKPFLRVRVDLTNYDSPKAQQLRKQFRVTGVPEILFLDSQGDEIQEARVIGFVGAAGFLQRVKDVNQWESSQRP